MKPSTCADGFVRFAGTFQPPANPMLAGKAVHLGNIVAELANSEVVRVLADWSLPSPIHLVSPQQRRHSAKVKALVEHAARGFNAGVGMDETNEHIRESTKH